MKDAELRTAGGPAERTQIEMMTIPEMNTALWKLGSDVAQIASNTIACKQVIEKEKTSASIPQTPLEQLSLAVHMEDVLTYIAEQLTSPHKNSGSNDAGRPGRDQHDPVVVWSGNGWEVRMVSSFRMITPYGNDARFLSLICEQGNPFNSNAEVWCRRVRGEEGRDKAPLLMIEVVVPEIKIARLTIPVHCLGHPITFTTGECEMFYACEEVLNRLIDLPAPEDQ